MDKFIAKGKYIGMKNDPRWCEFYFIGPFRTKKDAERHLTKREPLWKKKSIKRS